MLYVIYDAFFLEGTPYITIPMWF